MKNEAITEIYDNYIIEQREELSPSRDISGPAFDELDRLVYSNALMRDPDVIIDQAVSYAAASQQMGFILGFKYALRLAAEAFGREAV